jgi:hypothetical protein
MTAKPGDAGPHFLRDEEHEDRSGPAVRLARGDDVTETSEQPDPKVNAGDGKERAPSSPPQEKTKAPGEPEPGSRNAIWAAAPATVLFGFAALILGLFIVQDVRDMSASKTKAAALEETGKTVKAPTRPSQAPEPARKKKKSIPLPTVKNGESVTIYIYADYAEEASSRYGKITLIFNRDKAMTDIWVNGNLETSAGDDNEFKHILALFSMRDRDVFLICSTSAGNSYLLLPSYRFLTMRKDGSHAWSEPFEASFGSLELRVERRGEKAIVTFLRSIDKSPTKEVVFADGGLTAKDFPLTAQTLERKCRVLYRMYGECFSSDTGEAQEGTIYGAAKEITHFDRKAFGALIDAKAKNKKLIGYDAFKKRFCNR